MADNAGRKEEDAGARIEVLHRRQHPRGPAMDAVHGQARAGPPQHGTGRGDLRCARRRSTGGPEWWYAMLGVRPPDEQSRITHDGVKR